MEQYISKSALVAEIEKELNTAKKYSTEYVNGKKYALKKILSFLNTLEVKEVDLEKHLKEDIEDVFYDLNGVAVEDVKDIAKHFYELGLKTQYSSISIPNIDDLFEEDGIDPNSKDVKIFKESYYTALEKLKEKKGE